MPCEYTGQPLAQARKKVQPNDALPLALEVPAPTLFIDLFRVDNPSHSLDFDSEPQTEFPGFLSGSRAKGTLSPCPVLVLESPIFLDNDDVFLPPADTPMSEFVPKRNHDSSLSTDAKAPKTSVVDGVPHSLNRPTNKQRLNTDNSNNNKK